jgi:hypothetical protein
LTKKREPEKLSVDIEPEQTEQITTETKVLQPKPSFFSSLFSRKKYGLFEKVANAQPALIQTYQKYYSKEEIDALLPGGLSEDKTYFFAEVDGKTNAVISVMWTHKRQVGRGRTVIPPWKRLEKDLSESMEPIVSVANAIQQLDETISKIRGGGLDEEKIRQIIKEEMKGGWGTPYQIPPPQFSGSIPAYLHPYFLFTIPQLAKETVKMGVEGIREGMAGMMQQSSGQDVQIPSLSNIMQQATPKVTTETKPETTYTETTYTGPLETTTTEVGNTTTTVIAEEQEKKPEPEKTEKQKRKKRVKEIEKTEEELKEEDEKPEEANQT